ncbi:hypothetical protein [Brevibacterium siliguriense]|nr:hypothetical protein [Brevibacterium siliguriense]
MKKLALAATAALGISALAVGTAAASASGTEVAVSDGVHSNEAPSSGSADSSDDSVVKEADLALKYRTMTPYEVTHGKGIEYTIDGLKKGDRVSTSLDNELHDVEKDGAFDGAVTMDKEPDARANVEFTVKLERGAEPERVFHTRVRIIEGDRGDYDDGTLVMDPDSTMLDEGLYQEGLNLTMVNCSAEDEVDFTVYRKDEDGRKKIWEKSQVAGEDESASVRYMPREGMPPTGEYEAVAECGDLEDSAKIDVDPTEPTE